MQVTNNPDFEQVTVLLKQCDLPTQDITREKLAHFYAIADPSGLVGVIGLELHGDFGLLRSLAVDPDFRNQGIAKVLLSAIEQTAREQHLLSLFLLTTTAPLYFRQQGYDEISRHTVPEAIKSTSEFASICPASAIVMCKVLEWEQ